jgi:signal transduction histidine kinase
MTTRARAESGSTANGMSVDVLLHELRNPLAVIRGHAQHMRQRGGTSESDRGKLTRALAGIEAATLRMSRILDEYQTLQRMFEPMPNTLHLQPMNLIPFVRQLVAGIALEQCAAAWLVFLTSQSHLDGMWDRPLLERALTNLVANALKFSPDEHPVHVTTDLEGPDAIIAVSDRDIGIPAGELASVFDWRYRGSDADHIPGTGIGLKTDLKIAVGYGGGGGLSSPLVASSPWATV